MKLIGKKITASVICEIISHASPKAILSLLPEAARLATPQAAHDIKTRCQRPQVGCQRVVVAEPKPPAVAVWCLVPVTFQVTNQQRA